MGCTESIQEPTPSKSPEKKITSSLASFQERYPRVTTLPQIKAALEESEALGKHTPLLACVTLKNLARHFNSVPKWASPPLTVGCVAISILNWLIKRGQLKIPEPELLENVEMLLGCFLETSDSIRQHLVYFFVKAVGKYSRAFSLAVVEHNVYLYLNKFWFTRHFHFQQYLVQFSMFTFAVDTTNKRRFNADGGVDWLVKLLEYTSFSGSQFRCIVQALDEYILDDTGKANPELVRVVLEVMGEATFRKFSHRNLTGADCEVFDNFLEKLIEFKDGTSS